MPRKPRFFLPDIPVHIVQRGHSREPVFFENGNYQACLGWLKEAANRKQDREQVKKDKKRIRELERELNCREKALAETAALLVLRKKLNAL